MLNFIYLNSSTTLKRKQISMIFFFSLSKLKHEHTLEAKAMRKTAGWQAPPLLVKTCSREHNLLPASVLLPTERLNQ